MANEARKCFNKNIQPTLGDKKLSELDRFMIRSWHRKFQDRPYAGNRSLQVLSRMFSYAEEEGLRDTGTNPCKGVKLFSEGSRRRFATKEELVKIMRFLEDRKEAHPAKVGFLMAILFSGSRPKALQKAQRSQIRMLDGAGILTFRGKSTAKTGREESVVFPPAIIELIKKVNAPDGTLFGIPFPRYFWKELREQLGCLDLWGRDFRRTFATTALSAGVSMGMIGELLNHSDPRSTQIYAKLYDDDRVTASLMIANKIAEFGKKAVDEEEMVG